jgi:hypothetical protein
MKLENNIITQLQTHENDFKNVWNLDDVYNLSGESERRVHNFTMAYDRTTDSLIITNEALWGDVCNNETEQQSIQKYYSHSHSLVVFSTVCLCKTMPSIQNATSKRTSEAKIITLAKEDFLQDSCACC